MLLISGILLLAAGVLCFAIDRRAAHYFDDHLQQRWAVVIHRTTDWAKGSHWLQIACAVALLSWAAQRLFGADAHFALAQYTSLAFLAALAVASVILHTVKVVLGRRRPRDELELRLFGWRPFRFDLQYDSFPSGHALTIFCVATIMSGVAPALAVVWFAAALYLALTRVLLNSHFLSDVCVGAAVAMIVTREVVIAWFPALLRPWF